MKNIFETIWSIKNKILDDRIRLKNRILDELKNSSKIEITKEEQELLNLKSTIIKEKDKELSDSEIEFLNKYYRIIGLNKKNH